MKIYVIAGEASGDLHGSNLIKELKSQDSSLEFRAWGGDLMEKQGATLVKHYRELAFMGFVEVIMNLGTILKNLKFCKKDILDYKPDLLLLVDYPGFNLRIAEFAAENNIKVYYYISPQIWAWKENRVKKIKKHVDEMYVILPFEKDFYKKHGMNVHYLGHPLTDIIDPELKTQENIDLFKRENNLDDRPIIALVPGSRKQEISIMLPEMISVITKFKEYQFVVAGAPNIESNYYSDFDNSLKVVHGKTQELYLYSKAALITSGTATLEAALSNLPQIVCYKANSISIWIARRLIKVKYISLVNLIADKEVVKELIQNDLNPKKLETELSAVLQSPEKSQVIQKEYQEIRRILGNSGASEKIAKHMLKSLTAGQ